MDNANPAPLTARKARPLKGIAQVPGDKSISQRALILGALAEGETRISGLLESGDVHSTAGALRGFGAELTAEGPGRWRVVGTGVGNWQSPRSELDFGNSGTGSRLVMGAMATTAITAVFTGDASLRSRPMARVVDPLKAFGVTYEGQGPKALMPLTLHGAKDAKAVTAHVAAAQRPGEIGAAAGGAERPWHQPHLARIAHPRPQRKDAGGVRRQDHGEPARRRRRGDCR